MDDSRTTKHVIALATGVVRLPAGAGQSPALAFLDIPAAPDLDPQRQAVLAKIGEFSKTNPRRIKGPPETDNEKEKTCPKCTPSFPQDC